MPHVAELNGNYYEHTTNLLSLVCRRVSSINYLFLCIYESTPA